VQTPCRKRVDLGIAEKVFKVTGQESRSYVDYSINMWTL